MSNNRLLVFVAPLLFLTLLLLPRPGLCQESANCLACHSAMKGRIKTASGALVELNSTKNFGKTWLFSFRLPLGFPTIRTPRKQRGAADRSFSFKNLRIQVDPVAGAACITCLKRFKMVLGAFTVKISLRRTFRRALCLDCHGSPHYITPAKDENSPKSHQVETCGKCHGDEKLIEKYKLEENVMESFRESFHGRKLHLGHTRAPACSSCHNSHDIRSKTDPESPVFGKIKLVTCGKCHKGANEKFVPAITHKRPGPIPHYGEKLLILLTIGVFAFIVIHVLLEAFSDIRDAIFRKGGRRIMSETTTAQ
jgi:hypothetical protein